MKVIDLLNKIANGEEVPRKFMVDGDTLYIGEDKFIEYENGKKIEWFIYPSWLNEEIEIIEDEPRNIEVCGSLFTRSEYNRLAGIKEDKKIRKIKVDYSPDIEEKIFYEDGDKPRHCVLGDAGTELLINKIDEIIDYINGGTNGE